MLTVITTAMRRQVMKINSIVGPALASTLMTVPATLLAATYYVSPTGDDTAAGTQAQPLRSIQRGADVARAGDIVLVAPGVYYEREISIRNGGTATKPVTIKAAGGGQSVIDHGLRVANWTPTGNGIFAGQALFTGRESVGNSTIVRVVIDGVAYRKAANAATPTSGEFSVTGSTGEIQVFPISGGSPNGRDVIILSETTALFPGILIFDDGRGGAVGNVIIDGFVHRGASTAIWGARFTANQRPIPVNRNLTVKNCEIGFNWQYAFRLDNWVGATMDNCNVYENGHVNWPRGENKVTWPHAIIGFNADRVNILGSKIHDNHGEGVGPYYGSSFWVIRNNEVYDNYSVNIYVDTDEGNVIVDRNLIYLTGKYQSPGTFGSSKAQFSDGIRIANERADLESKDATPLINKITITNNIIIGTGDGIMSFPYANDDGVIGKSGLINSLIANNTIINTTTGPGTFQTGINVSRGYNVNVFNNISYPQRIRLGAGIGGSVTGGNNLVKDAAGIEVFNRATSTANVFGVPSFTTGSGFAASNYQLSAGALGINGGRSNAAVTTDYSGIGRPIGGAYDIGAFEK